MRYYNRKTDLVSQIEFITVRHRMSARHPMSEKTPCSMKCVCNKQRSPCGKTSDVFETSDVWEIVGTTGRSPLRNLFSTEGTEMQFYSTFKFNTASIFSMGTAPTRRILGESAVMSMIVDSIRYLV